MKENMPTENTTETKPTFVPDCHILRFGSWNLEITPAKFVRETKSQVIVATEGGMEWRFSGTRAQCSEGTSTITRVGEGRNSYHHDLSFNFAHWEARRLEDEAIKDRKLRTHKAVAVISQLQGHHLTEAQVAILEACVAQLEQAADK